MMNKDTVLISSLDDPRMKRGSTDHTTWGVAILKTSLRAALERESAKDARMASLEPDCRIIAGALGEFYGVGDGPKLTEKIASLRAEKAEAELASLRAEKIDEGKIWSACPNCAALRAENERLRGVVEATR